MATQFPIDPNADRFIDGMKMTDDGGAIVDLPEEGDLEVEELDDGSAIASMGDFKGPTEDEDFYSNLAETINLYDLEKIGMRYLDLIEKDKEAREKRDKQYEVCITPVGFRLSNREA